MHPSARRTGRPRSAAADRAILAATRHALAELGWAKLTMSDVATRAGVARTTLYRRWPGKNELVVDAVADLFDAQLDLPDRGSLPADLEGVVLRFAELLERPETRIGLLAVFAESTRDPVLRARIRAAIVTRQRELVVRGRERAQLRGELPQDPPGAAGSTRAARRVDLIFDIIAGSVVHRTLVSDQPVDAAWAREFADLLLGGLTASDGGAGRGPAPPPGQKPGGSV
ncbi:TetR/AcrR family transcriptional regulator [Streptomyces sp. ACA25]|uniref:TetR/AcrR family transcriptional regulator n=1 Tax=Streptomyces sp. ACA25 TaxID=3022596 RepID=UPI002307AE31|nr:TetR/AcrR family transcriptional regulator [Streptomyces sp. ACA25]MDB1087662.1 TetR/AcrR family transcriptional regulator [Streptomyces sp. ACA25]